MDMDNQMNSSKSPGSNWPYTSLLLFGYFGKNSPGAKKLAIRNTIGLLLTICGIIFSGVVGQTVYALPVLTLAPLGIVIIMWAYKEYLSGLDELSRMIQYEAFAFSYGAAIAIGISIYATGLYVGWAIPAIWILLAEGLRGIALVYIAGKYA